MCLAMQDCLEQVIAVGCAGLNMDDATLSAEHTQQQKALFFDLKLVLGPGSSCLCHKYVLLMLMHPAVCVFLHVAAGASLCLSRVLQL